ncbi:MAG: D-glucuronyl C5-epimerase family protein [Planctomycetes bacterium]|nr:D-glucuronyl C5-epimerase family protein [Planctomycetota bacterium]
MNELSRLKYLLAVYGLGRGTITRSWSDPAVVDLSGIGSQAGIGAYPLDYSRDDRANLLTDSAGIPLVDYATLGRQYNPWFIGHVALGRHTKWTHHADPMALAGFIRLADWLVVNAQPWNQGRAWIYHFDWFGGHRAPWISSISQALGISALLRAAAATAEARYADVARGAIEVLLAPMDQGGTSIEWLDGTVSYEEAATHPPTSILNGHLFSLFALSDAARWFACERYAQWLERGWAFLRSRLSDYDLGFWSCYSLRRGRAGTPDVASVHYHGVHVAQLRAAAAITGESHFADWAKRFEGYQLAFGCRLKALWLKRFNKVIDL